MSADGIPERTQRQPTQAMAGAAIAASAGRPRVSVIMPVHNQAEYIGQAIVSVRRQTLTDWELIVVDDGSTDATAEVVERHAETRLRYVARPQQERSLARNHGLELAQGHLVAFLDADDFWQPGYLAKQVANFDAHPGLGLSFTAAYDTDRTGHAVRVRGLHPSGVLPQSEFLARMVLGNRVANTSVVMAPADILRALGGFDNDAIPAEDWDLWLRLAMRYPVASVAEPLVYYRRYHIFMPSRLLARRADESSVHILEKAFAALTDPHVSALYSQALGGAYWRGAWIHYMVEDTASGQAWLAKARSVWPELFMAPYQAWLDSLVVLADELYDIFTPLNEALQRLDRLFANLPAWAAELRPLKTAAKGRFCGLHVFSSYAQGQRRELLRAAPLAVQWHPQWLANRGFLAIWARAWLGRGWARPKAAVGSVL